jgi:hypothetical protein
VAALFTRAYNPESMAENDITLGTVMQHMQHLHGIVLAHFDRLEAKFDQLETKVDRNHINLSSQIEAIDKRLDSIEIEALPRRVTVLEKKVGIR